MAESINMAAVDRMAAARAAKAAGRAVVAVVGPGVPIELVLACGAMPVRIVADAGGATPAADDLVGTAESAEMRALIEQALGGGLAFADLLVITRPHEWLYYYLKEAVRLGAEGVPPLHMHDLVPSAEASLRAYNRQRLERLAEAVARAIGVVPTSAALERAIAVANRRRAALRDVQRRRDAGLLGGADAVAMIAASHVLGPETFADQAEAWVEGLSPPSGPRLLLLASDPAEDGALHRAIEAAGVVVVAEDSEWGARAATPDIAAGDDPLDALLDDLHAIACGPDVSPRSARLAWAEAAMARDDIAGVVFAVPPGDRRFGWDYPGLRDRAAGLGLPQLLLRDDPRADPASVTAAVAGFVATLGREAAA
ncbi:2-hydroxyacyl-CoA dehydratase family protein [Sphingomonas gilva]|nr:2-hydroxyacyl-CoA dehydratase family protein [Sphingomonas gilva]